MISSTLYFDGDCAFCSRAAWFIDRRDKRRTLKFAALESDEGRALKAARSDLAAVDSLIWVDRDAAGNIIRALIFGDAALAVGLYLGGRYALAARVARAVPRPIRDSVYRTIARHRAKL